MRRPYKKVFFKVPCDDVIDCPRARGNYDGELSVQETGR